MAVTSEKMRNVQAGKRFTLLSAGSYEVSGKNSLKRFTTHATARDGGEISLC
jgi:hypothetical protein